MIRHEITINTGQDYHYLATLNRDLKNHREGGLPAWRVWNRDETLVREMYYLHGKRHREDGPSEMRWHSNGNLGHESYSLNGDWHREDGPAWREWLFGNGNLHREEYYLKGVQYAPT
jgi:hypothetical protein